MAFVPAFHARPYQVAVIESVMQSPRQRVLVCLSTGLGKTVTFSMLSQRFRGRVLFLVHRRELVDQIVQTLQKMTGELVAVEMADQRGDSNRRERYRSDYRKCRLVVASIQSMRSMDRLSSYDPNDFDAVVIDECHRALAPSYDDVVQYFFDGNNSLRLVGFTATPKRQDGRPLSALFDEVVFDYQMQQAIADGWSVPLIQRYVSVDKVHWTRIETNGPRDYTEAELEERMRSEEQIRRLVDPFFALIGDRQAIAFCPGVDSSRRCSEAFNAHKRHGSHWLSAKTPGDQRADWVARYRNNEVQCLFNFGLFVEGFDAAKTAAIGILRPTKNRTFYEQAVGRGTRPWPGILDGLPDDVGARKRAIESSPKPDCLVVDLEGVTLDQNLCSLVDLLGGTKSKEVRDYIKKVQKEDGGGATTEEEYESLEADLKLEVEHHSFLKSNTLFESAVVDPFRVESSGIPNPIATLANAKEDPVCYKWQADKLVRLGMSRPMASCLTRRAADAMIARLKSLPPADRKAKR